MLSFLDIGSWLELFGFQLHNVLPGFPKPEKKGFESSYELVQLQTKTQEWDPGKVSISLKVWKEMFWLLDRK